MRIGIANDSALAVTALRRVLALEPSLEVAWVAPDGDQAVTLAKADTPDVVLMDLLMPVMDGIEATRRIMAQSPCAIVVVTSDLARNASMVFEAMGHGAIDAVDTPALDEPDASVLAGPLLRKLRNVGAMLTSRPHAPPRPGAAPSARPAPTLVAVGASAGGPAALAALFGSLPADFPAALVVVQHVDAAFAPGMATWLDAQSRMPVRIAAAGEKPVPGTILLAGTNDHLYLERGSRLAYTAHPRQQLYRPSVDVFLHSVAAHWHGSAVGVLLTGMGRDGADGLKAMRERGWLTIAQDRSTSAVYGMPKAAAALDAAVEILPLPRIAPRLIQACAVPRNGPLEP